MLSKPDRGWTNVNIGRHSFRCSYLTDIPTHLLNAVEWCVLSSDPCAVCVLPEHTQSRTQSEDRYVLVFDVNASYLISTERFVCWQIELPITAIARDLIRDIRTYIEDWVDWPAISSEPGFDPVARKESLLTSCMAIEQSLPKHLS